MLIHSQTSLLGARNGGKVKARAVCERLLVSCWRETLIRGGWVCNPLDRKHDLGLKRSRKLELSITLCKVGDRRETTLSRKVQTNDLGKQGSSVHIAMRNKDPKPEPGSESTFMP